MQFCDDCGSTMVKLDGDWVCRSCSPERINEATTQTDTGAPPPRQSGLDELSTTSSGSVKKADAMRWLDSLDVPTDREIRNAMVPKPSGFSGSTYATSISNVRVTGDPEFVETIAGLLKPITDLENGRTRVEVNLKKTENRDTGETTGNYALYLSVTERG